ncbi:MAG: 30S ribosomal protein S6 [Candidatus Omnitrophica bacterium CG11_big_fil_rev_8_21_14_0_20_45_26]|uniref:Small ribosomal subunit protein bS6 n=1 Tax=Candidatus Abzuiibacterium crystallinum TaxID=1974748 RepID=A0A2H0LSF9_9BACT|nr:MAG: 30S ribosomal protein S6 [Candidatus Omnitrophica bacterium CG11_big_fil_rev_8_21_14_0_20_45_26]PIW63410.1 MAG: 30S ribosomal protein S6 [Candidatus Omnitrophica bacterium CG12_big_fil_rev_8_21_14_0_65_45_16]
MIRQYEAIVIVPVTAAGEKFEALKAAYAEQLKKLGGKQTAIHELGRRAFGYVIQKHREGLYFVVDFELDSLKLRDFYKAMMLVEGILRHTIFTKPDLFKKKAAKPKKIRKETSQKAPAHAKVS